MLTPHGKQFMKLTTQKLLFDAFSACNLIEEFVAGHDFNSYRASALLRSAVERQFEIIGEALIKQEMKMKVLLRYCPIYQGL